MSNILQTFEEPHVLVLPTTIKIPDLEHYTDSQIITFAASIADQYLESENRMEILFQLKSEFFKRIQRILSGNTFQESKVALVANAHNILCLMEAYTFAATGAVSQGGFGAPAFLWPNSELEEIIIEYFSMDSKLHDHSRTVMVLDFLRLYIERLSREN